MTLSFNPPKPSMLLPKTGGISVTNPAIETGSTIRLEGTDCLIKAQVPLSNFTSFRVGGPAEWYAAPQHVTDLQACFAWANAEGLSITLLGAGSNLLISDQGLPGLVIGTRRLRCLEFHAESGQVTVGAGEPIPRLAWQAASQGWQGLEWAVGIPGTIGGAVVMNAGAHNSCIADRLVKVKVLLPDGTVKVFNRDELQYQYRTSILQGKTWLVLQATFQLDVGADPAQVTEATAEHLDRRKATQPYHLPSCGSVFRNPEEYKAGWLIEQLGLKGHQIGGAQIAQRHANFILNCGGATASDIFNLIRHIQHEVEDRWSLSLEPEVRILGEFQGV